MKIIILIFGIILCATICEAQNIKLKKDTELIIVKNCYMCSQGVDFNEVIAENYSHADVIAKAQFHNFHINVFNENYEKAMVLSEKLSLNNHLFLGVLEYMQGYMYLRKRLFNEAEKYFQKSLLYDLDSTLKAHSRLNLASIFQEKKNFDWHWSNCRKQKKFIANIKILSI